MTKPSTTDRLTYAAVIFLSVIVLVLVVLSASFLVDTRVVYQGF